MENEQKKPNISKLIDGIVDSSQLIFIGFWSFRVRIF